MPRTDPKMYGKLGNLLTNLQVSLRVWSRIVQLRWLGEFCCRAGDSAFHCWWWGWIAWSGCVVGRVREGAWSKGTCMLRCLCGWLIGSDVRYQAKSVIWILSIQGKEMQESLLNTKILVWGEIPDVNANMSVAIKWSSFGRSCFQVGKVVLFADCIFAAVTIPTTTNALYSRNFLITEQNLKWTISIVILVHISKHLPLKSWRHHA